MSLLSILGGQEPTGPALLESPDWCQPERPGRQRPSSPTGEFIPKPSSMNPATSGGEGLSGFG